MSRLTGALLAAILVSLFAAYLHPFGNAHLYDSAPPAPMHDASLPPPVRGLLEAKCADCHSTQTRAPFYGHLAPVSWLLERDIVQARSRLDLSLWDTYPVDRRQLLQAQISQQVKTRTMPPLQYRLVHRNAQISEPDMEVIAAWMRSPAPAPDAIGAMRPSDPLRGRAVFEKRCTGCHAMEADREGPRLQGVYGRMSGAVPGFAYSDALEAAHLRWDDVSLERWLTDPDTAVPGNNMAFHVASPQERQDLVSFLKEQR